jgi:hypothetical protein
MKFWFNATEFELVIRNLIEMITPATVFRLPSTNGPKYAFVRTKPTNFSA